jgi:hypothetical protein
MCLASLSLLSPRYDSNEPSPSLMSLLLKTPLMRWDGLLVCSKRLPSGRMFSLFTRSHAWSLTQNSSGLIYVSGVSIFELNGDILCLKLTNYCPMLVCSFCLFKLSLCSISSSFQDRVAPKAARTLVMLFLLFKILLLLWHVLPSSKRLRTVRTCSF